MRQGVDSAVGGFGSKARFARIHDDEFVACPGGRNVE